MKPQSSSRQSRTPTPTSTSKPRPKQSYLCLSNQQYLIRTLILLDINASDFQKQTKSPLSSDLFPRSQPHPTASKAFFYVVYFCLQKLSTPDEIVAVSMWYPPRSVNEQIQFKKAAYHLLTNFQVWGRLPKGFVVTKGVLMGETTHQGLVEFLRFLSEMALRHQYLQKYSQTEKLIQLTCNPSPNSSPNSINQFYVYPFVPSCSSSGSCIAGSLDLGQLQQNYHNHIKIYLKKICNLKTTNCSPVLSQIHSTLMKQYMQQKTISDKLSQKVPPQILTHNRAFDRRTLIDTNSEIWDELQKLDCSYMQESTIPVLKVEGEIDNILSKWQPVKGLNHIIEANQIMSSNAKSKIQLDQSVVRFRELCKKIQDQLQIKR